MLNKKYKYVVFDFDGVVCDSTNECMVTAWNAWERWNKRNGFRLSLDEFSQEEISIFRPLRPYVRGAGEYYIIMRAINSIDVVIKNQDDFDNLRSKWEDQLKPFKEYFFAERIQLRNEDFESWIELHEVYNDVIAIMKTLHNQHRLLIATLKDGESVRMILKNNGIDISNKDIMDQAQISSKLEALNYFVSKKKIKKEDLCFLDDNITHLTDPKNYDFNVFLTGWGNTMAEHKEKAMLENIPVLETINDGSF